MRGFHFKYFIPVLFVLILSGSAMTAHSNRYYYIKSVISGDRNRGYWDLPGGGRRYKKGDDLHLWAFDRGDDRKYMITPAGNGWDYISPANAACGDVFCGTVDVAVESMQNGSKLNIMDLKLTDNPGQLFKVSDIGDGKFKIYINGGGGKKIICTENGADKNGTSVIVLDDNDNPACQWRFIEPEELE